MAAKKANVAPSVIFLASGDVSRLKKESRELDDPGLGRTLFSNRQVWVSATHATFFRPLSMAFSTVAVLGLLKVKGTAFVFLLMGDPLPV